MSDNDNIVVPADPTSAEPVVEAKPEVITAAPVEEVTPVTEAAAETIETVAEAATEVVEAAAPVVAAPVEAVADVTADAVEVVAEAAPISGDEQISVPLGAIETPAPAPVVEESVLDKKAQKAQEKADKKAQKAEAKQAKKAEKAEAKAAAKEEKIAAKAEAKQALIDQCPREYKPISTSKYFWFSILGGIPGLGLILAIFLSLIPRNKNFKCFQKSILAFHIIGIILLLAALLVLMFVFQDDMDDIVKAFESIATAFEMHLF